MRTLKFKGRPTNALFTAVNQIFSGSSQLTTTAEHCFVVWIVRSDLITARSVVVGSCEEPPNIWLTVAKNALSVELSILESAVLLKGAVSCSWFYQKYNKLKSNKYATAGLYVKSNIMGVT